MNTSLSRLLILPTFAAFTALAPQVQADDGDLRMSSIGFQPERSKFITVHGDAETFEVRDNATHALILSGTVPAGSGSGDERRSKVDISDLSEGTYYLSVPNVGRSVVFEVGDEVFNDALLLTLMGYYGWRSGEDIEFKHQGARFKHAASHLDDGIVRSSDEEKDGTGGWYDAGDYGKYVVNGAFTAASLLKAWEHFEDNLKDITLPQYKEGSKIPHFLATVRFELEWLLKMQIIEGDNTGAVHTKLTPLRFSEFVKAEDDPSIRYFAGHGSPATATFAAVMAQATRIYKPFDEDFADEMLSAAKSAHGWLMDNPEFLRGDVTDIWTGDYRGDEEHFPAKELWAAAELWETTGNDKYLELTEELMEAEDHLLAHSWDWEDLRNMGIYTYILSERKGRDEELVDAALGAFASASSLIRSTVRVSHYGRGDQNYYWGSNGGAARNCMTLQVAHMLAPNDSTLDACSQQISYLTGRNEYGRSFVTGLGLEPPLNPHHRISAADNQDRPYPGLLIGGGTTDDNWLDLQENFQTNEVAINYNAALVYALAGFVEGEMVYDGSKNGTAAPPVRPEPTPDDVEDGQGGQGGESGGDDSPESPSSAKGDGSGCRLAKHSPPSPVPSLWWGAVLCGLIVRRRRRGNS